jgi:hypothetical protein
MYDRRTRSSSYGGHTDFGVGRTGLLDQPVLVFIHSVRWPESFSVWLDELVPGNGFPAKIRTTTILSAGSACKEWRRRQSVARPFSRPIPC